MKTAQKPTSDNKNTPAKKTAAQAEIKSDFPLSEKDEVKAAESRLKEAQEKKGDINK